MASAALGHGHVIVAQAYGGLLVLRAGGDRLYGRMRGLLPATHQFGAGAGHAAFAAAAPGRGPGYIFEAQPAAMISPFGHRQIGCWSPE